MKKNPFEKYCCPICKRDFFYNEFLICKICNVSYKIIKNIPILISAKNPIFGSADLSRMESSGFRKPFFQRVGGWIPSPSLDLGRRRWMPKLLQELNGSGGVCLIVGAGDDAKFTLEMRQYFDDVIVSDVVLGPGVDVICDGSELPFRSGSIDCIFVMAVLEHVLQPETVVSDINRVLKDGGLVIADTPFMQPVHMRQFDFTRFTDLGYRWLFRSFEEVDRGVSVGPASSLVWSIMYLFRSMGWSSTSSLVLSTMARLLFFWIKYLDFFIAHRPSASDAAAGIYFVGRKSSSDTIDAQQLLDDYQGY